MHEDLLKKASDLKVRLDNVKVSFGLENKKKELSECESKSMDPNLWNDQENARELMQRIGNLKNEIKELSSMGEDIETLYNLFKDDSSSQGFEKDIKILEKRMKNFELSSFLSEPYDNKNALVSIHAGQGGVEAMDWSSMIMRMYLRFAEKKGWRTETIEVSEGEEAGIKSVTFKVDGPYVFGYLKGEAGTHRLVRQSPFNADNLRQTSFCLVEVMPELLEADLPSLVIKDEDLEWQFFRSSSKGGQNVQKVSTAVRLTHKSTGIVVTAQTERFQEQNRKIALNLLRAKLWIREEALKEAKIKDIKGEYRPASWGNQIRSYVLHPYKMVKDLRTEVESSNPDAVLDGELDEFIDAEIRELK
jgi:peptide chain release factor 2